MRDTVRTTSGVVWRYVRSAPGTYLWLTVLFVTTVIAHRVAPDQLTHILQNRSTNLRHLLHNPLPSLFRSAFWIDGNGWFLYAIVFTLIHAPVERWLGTARWVAVVVIAHVTATYISQGILLWAIDSGRAPQSDLAVIDIGVSYGLAGVAGILVYRIARRWRWLYGGALAVVCLTPIVWPLVHGTHFTFTDIGHLCAAIVGLACYPITRIGRRRTRVVGDLPPVSPLLVEHMTTEPALPPVSPHLLERMPAPAVTSPARRRRIMGIHDRLRQPHLRRGGPVGPDVVG
ncbi:rhomboid family intramembrane serine protease [Williamsia sp. Leaf354]|uniref:rhomboid family intramembrane serine protease n=1 Tax=Williamsia sp. Leaf354 TaxID=1736349 RepID=UPI000A852F61|nr:rhomboid family intramembrane serine protease [Williamsia sp. Leaf354]